ncbi:(R)-mandelonitrile lyase [Rhodoligotrophos ferricapiens]|uniref:(R)-mandelonitrile lyase n=1 Tax=Rhodoligotrophos ferricapiens TaxID=3069264 RepID=UPI00315DFE76
MEIKRCGSIPSRPGKAGWFTGKTLQNPVFETPEPARVRATIVTFDPGARTAWHTHPLGQTLYVLSGCGRAQVWGEKIVEIRAGDVVWFAPGEKHWHGAAPETSMTHFAMHEALNGSTVDWLEEVSEADYNAKP